MSEPQLTIKYMRLDEAAKLRWRKNPKLHDIGAIVESIRRYGFVDTPGFDETLGAFTYGNGRDEALEWMHAQGDPLPPGVLLDTDGMWLMPYTSGVNQKTAEQAEALAIDHNNLTMAGGNFTPYQIAEMWSSSDYTDVLSSLALSSSLPITVDGDALDGLLRGMQAPVEPGAGGDDFDTTPADGPTRCQPGDLWRIGPHRLLVGDCTDPANVARLMGGERAGAVVTDPPYAFGLASTSELATKSGGWHDMMNNATWFADRYQQWKRLIGNGPLWVFCNWRTIPILMKASVDSTVGIDSLMVWYKDWIGPGGMKGLRPTYELIAFTALGEYVIPTRDVQDFVTVPWSSHKPSGHNAEKPVELFQHLLRVSGITSFFEPFLGSGTGLIAAHREGAQCFGMEADAKNADVILRRAEAEGLPCERAE